MKTVTLLGFIGSMNLGDEAINQSILKSFASSDYHLRILSLNPIQTEELVEKALLKNYEIININNHKAVRDSIRTCDLFLCGGGGIIQDQSSIYNLPYFIRFISFAKKNNRKVMLYGVGVGPLYSSFSKLLVRKYLNKVDKVTVRDMRSKEILLENGVRETLIEVTADPALSLEAPEVYNLNLRPHNRVIVVCLRHWFDIYRALPVKVAFLVNKISKINKKRKNLYDHFISEISKALDHFIETHNDQIVLFPYWVGRDSKVNRDIYNTIGYKEDVVIWDKEVDPLTALSIINNADLVLGMRLHSIIYAANLGKRIVAVNYSPKVKNFLEMVLNKDLISNIMINPSAFSSEELITKMEYSFSQDYLSELKEKIRNLQMIEKRNFQSVKEILGDGDYDE
jgi:polysaccharide pyruvyl transferase WcaK-like protein